MANPNWFKKLQNRWGVSASRAIIILVVFALTGFSIMFLKKPIQGLLLDSADKNIIHDILYYVLILPLYNLVLLIYGFIFGQFSFFWEFEKRFFKRMISVFSRKSEKTLNN